MDVSTNTLIKKMREEMNRIEQASTAEEAKASFSHIRMFCELWLDEYKQQKPKESNQSSVDSSISVNNIESQKTTKEQQILASAQQDLNEEDDLDRKSTRLNSSHV